MLPVLCGLLSLCWTTPANAQSAGTLISNTGNTSNAPSAFAPLTGATTMLAQRFTTGRNAGGYTVTDLRVKLGGGLERTNAITVSVCPVSNGIPVTASCIALAHRNGVWVGGINIFLPSRSSPIKLNANTTYALVASRSTQDRHVQTTSFASADSASVQGWSFPNTYDYFDGSWKSASAGRLQFRLSGTTDAETRGVTLSRTALEVSEGMTATYSVALDSLPTANVTVTPTSKDPGAASVSGALTFTTDNWATAQTVTVTGVQDSDALDERVTIEHSASGGNYSTVTISDVNVTVEDDDTGAPGAPGLTATVGDTRITLRWTAPTSDGNSAIIRYEYRYEAGSSVSAATAWTQVPDGIDSGSSQADERAFTVSSLSNDTAYTFEVRAVNGAGNGGAASVTATPVSGPPTLLSIVRRTPASSPTNADSLTWRVTFSKAMSNVDATDFDIAGTTATLSAAAVSGTTGAYDLTLSGGNLAGLDGTVTLSLASNHNIEDTAGTALSGATPTGGNQNTYLLDNTAPRVASITREAPRTSPTNSDTLKWRLEFSEAVSNLDRTDFSASGTTAAIAVAAIAGQTGSYELTLSGGNLSTADATVTLSFASGHNIADPAGNALSNTTPTGTNASSYVVDNTAPSISHIKRHRPSGEYLIEIIPSLTWRVTFSEAVRIREGGITVRDFRAACSVRMDEYFGNTFQASRLDAVAGSPGVYDLQFSPPGECETGWRAYLKECVNCSYSDAAGNTLSSSTPAVDTINPTLNYTSERYVVDFTNPRLDSASINGATLTLTYDEPLDTGSVPPATAYRVTVAGSEAALAGSDPVSVSGDKVTLTLASAVTRGQAVRLRYRWPASNHVKDPAGNRAATFNNRTITNNTPALPGAPGGLAATVSDGEVALAWTAAAANGSDIIKYQYRYAQGSSVGSSVAWSDVPDGDDAGDSKADETSYTVTGLTNDVVHAFELRAVNGVGDGAAASITARPGNATPTSSNKTITINEDATHTFSAADFAFADTDAADVLVRVKITALPSVGTLELDGSAVTADQDILKSGIDDGDLTYTPAADGNGSAYASIGFKVNDGQSDSDSAYAITFDVTAVNDAPTVANEIPDQTASARAPFSYTFPANAFSDVDSALSFAATLSDGSALPGWLTFTASSRKFEGTPAVADLGTISVKVTASEAAPGTESVSDTFDLSVVAGIPDAPGSLAARIGNLQVTLTWSAPSVTGGAAVSKYQYRYAEGASVGSSVAWSDVPDGDDAGASQADETSFTVTGLTNRTEYAFEVRAVNSAGESAAAATKATPANTPGAPASLFVFAGEGAAFLLWTAPTTDGGAAVSKYQYRYAAGASVGSSVAWSDVPDSDDAGASQADERTASITGLTNGVAYAFEVRAVNAAGGGTAVAATGTPRDTSAPSLASAAANGNQLVMTFSEELAAAANISNDAFTVEKTASGSEEAVDVPLGNTAPAISGKTVTLTLSAALAHSDSDVKVSYEKPGTDNNNRLQDASGNEVDDFTDQAVTNNTRAPNRPATGEPTISVANVYRVPSVLTASTSGISDPDGKTNNVFDFQWMRVKNGAASNIPGATNPTYTLKQADVGHTIQVSVSFEDDASNSEGPLTSDAVPASGAVTAAASCARPAPTGGAVQAGLFTVVVGRNAGGATHGYLSGGSGYGSLSEGSINPDDGNYAIDAATVAASAGRFSLRIRPAISSAFLRTLSVSVCGKAFMFASATAGSPAGTYSWTNTGLDWSGQAERVIEFLIDAAAPDLSSATLSGGTIKLIFSERLDSSSVPVTSAFPVTVNGAPASLASGGVSVSGRVVTLTLGTAPAADASVRVAYSKPTSGNTLRDPFGNEVDTFASTVADRAADTTAPAFSSASANGASLVLTFTEELGEADNLANSAFEVSRTPQGGSPVTAPLSALAAPLISGSTVTLTLATPLLGSDKNVKVAYTKPASGSGNRIRDVVGNEVDTFAAQPVTNATARPPSAPADFSVTAQNSMVLLTWNAPADDGGDAVTEYQYRYQAGASVGAGVNWIQVRDGSDPGPFRSDERSVAVTGLTNGAQYAFELRAVNSQGNGASATASATPENTPLSVISIDRQTPSSSPTNADSLTWRVVFSANVQNVTAADFDLAGATATLTAAAVGGSASVYDVTASGGNLAALNATVTLTLASGQDIQDTGGTALSGTTPTGINNNTYVLDNTAPATPAAAVAGDTLTLTFTEQLRAEPEPPATAFAVTVAGQARAVSAVSVSGKAVVLTLASATAQGETVTVAYTRPSSNSLRDIAGNEVRNFPALTATESMNDAPSVTSIARQAPAASPTNADSLTWRVTFSEDVQNVTADDFALAGTSATLTAAAVGGSARIYDVTASGGNLAALNATVTLTLAATHNIQDAGATPLSGTTPTGTNDNTYVVDNTAPANPAGAVNGDTLTLTFDEDLETGSAGVPAAGDFAVTAAGTAATLASSNPVTVSGKTVTLTLATAVTAGQAVTVAYTKPTSGNSLRDAFGNEVDTITARTVTNTTPGVVISLTTLSVDEGGTGTYTVVLNTEPPANVTVTPTSADTDIATVTGALTFTTANWDTAQTVTVTGAEDTDADDETVSITHTVSGYTGVTTAPAVAVSVEDDETNNEAGGAPAITVPNVYRVPAVLGVDFAGITDDDGKTGIADSAAYQWVRTDAGTDTDISGATNSTYTLAAADVGKTLKVKVRFTDDAGNAEGPLTSAARPASGSVTAAADCAAPTLTGGATFIGGGRAGWAWRGRAMVISGLTYMKAP